MRKTLITKLAVAGAAAALASGTLIGVEPALALPSNCSSWYTTDHLAGGMVCYSGTGYYRVSVACDGGIWPGSDYRRYSQWMPVGGAVVYANCSGDDRASDLRQHLISQL